MFKFIPIIICSTLFGIGNTFSDISKDPVITTTATIEEAVNDDEAVKIIRETEIKDLDLHFLNKLTPYLIDTFEQGVYKIDTKGNIQDYQEALNEVVSYYGGSGRSIQYYIEGNTIEIVDSSIPYLQNDIIRGKKYHKMYNEWLREMDCNHYFETPKDIERFVKSYFKFSVTDSNMWLAVESHTGQCWHYACVMADLCQLNGFDAQVVWNNEHAWVEINGEVYDPTIGAVEV